MASRARAPNGWWGRSRVCDRARMGVDSASRLMAGQEVHIREVIPRRLSVLDARWPPLEGPQRPAARMAVSCDGGRFAGCQADGMARRAFNSPVTRGRRPGDDSSMKAGRAIRLHFPPPFESGRLRRAIADQALPPRKVAAAAAASSASTPLCLWPGQRDARR